jgi:hypothetical protein
LLAVAWYDETARRGRLSVGYVGEPLAGGTILKANTWYCAGAKGNLTEVVS